MRPPSFDSYYANGWSHWALENGLPELPASLPRYHSVPVARWIGPRFAAVLHVSPYVDDDDSDAGFDTDVEIFHRAADRWVDSNGSGGSGWFDTGLVRPDLAPRVAGGGHQHWSGADDWYCCAIDGAAGIDAAYVEVIDSDGTTRFPIESTIGAWVAATDGHREALVRVIANDGAVLWESTFSGEP